MLCILVIYLSLWKWKMKHICSFCNINFKAQILIFSGGHIQGCCSSYGQLHWPNPSSRFRSWLLKYWRWSWDRLLSFWCCPSHTQRSYWYCEGHFSPSCFLDFVKYENHVCVVDDSLQERGSSWYIGCICSAPCMCVKCGLPIFTLKIIRSGS